MAALTPIERSRIRYHLGYLAVGAAASLQFGIPRPIQTLFLVETAMNNVIDDGYNIQNIKRILGILDGVECKLVQAQDFLAGQKLGNLEPRPDHPQALEIEYHRWANRLADVLGVPKYPYASRNIEAAGVVAGNLKVRH